MYRIDEASADGEAQGALDHEAAKFTKAVEVARKAHDRGKLTAEERLLHTCRLISEACGTIPPTKEPRYPAVEVLGWFARAVAEGCEVPVVGGRNMARLFRVELVPNARFRERFEHLRDEEGLTPMALGERVGMTRWGKRDGQRVRIGDATAVERALGITSKGEVADDGTEYRTMRLFLDYDLAVTFADALGLDYFAVGV